MDLFLVFLFCSLDLQVYPLLIPCNLDYHSYIIRIEARYNYSYFTPTLLLFFKIVIAILDPLLSMYILE